jgi:hypothetical protein
MKQKLKNSKRGKDKYNIVIKYNNEPGGEERLFQVIKMIFENDSDLVGPEKDN